MRNRSRRGKKPFIVRALRWALILALFFGVYKYATLSGNIKRSMVASIELYSGGNAEIEDFKASLFSGEVTAKGVSITDLGAGDVKSSAHIANMYAKMPVKSFFSTRKYLHEVLLSNITLNLPDHGGKANIIQSVKRHADAAAALYMRDYNTFVIEDLELRNVKVIDSNNNTSSIINSVSEVVINDIGYYQDGVSSQALAVSFLDLLSKKVLNFNDDFVNAAVRVESVEESGKPGAVDDAISIEDLVEQRVEESTVEIVEDSGVTREIEVDDEALPAQPAVAKDATAVKQENSQQGKVETKVDVIEDEAARMPQKSEKKQSKAKKLIKKVKDKVKKPKKYDEVNADAVGDGKESTKQSAKSKSQKSGAKQKSSQSRPEGDDAWQRYDDFYSLD